MRIITVFLLFLCSYTNAQQTAPLSSCISYEMNRIDKDTGEFVLRNVFAPQLFENLKERFPDQKIDWTAWTTSVSEYKDEGGKEKTKLKGCFDVSEIHEDSEFVSSIMRIAVTRFQAAMKFYSTPSSDHIPQEDVNSMLNGYEGLLKAPEVKKAIKKELEHNKRLQDDA